MKATKMVNFEVYCIWPFNFIFNTGQWLASYLFLFFISSKDTLPFFALGFTSRLSGESMFAAIFLKLDILRWLVLSFMLITQEFAVLMLQKISFTRLYLHGYGGNTYSWVTLLSVIFPGSVYLKVRRCTRGEVISLSCWGNLPSRNNTFCVWAMYRY